MSKPDGVAIDNGSGSSTTAGGRTSTAAPQISGRLVRSSLRYLRERVGEGLGREGGGADIPLLTRAVSREESIAVDEWVRVLRFIEQRHGNLPTWRLVREMTRATMAAAISSVWGTFLAGQTADTLLDRSGTFWSVSYSVGSLVMVERGPRRARLAIEGWPSPPEPVGACVAEACAVFLARLGETSPRVVERHSGERQELDVSW